MVAALAFGVGVFGAPGVRRARADGAFPDGQSVLLPRDRPHQIILGTNFGLVFTEDDGRTWTYTCEADGATIGGYRYAVGPPASGNVSGDRLFGISTPPPGAPVSTDDACTWFQGGGAIADPSNPTYAKDVFPDPSDPARVFLLATPQASPDDPGSVYRSQDGGVTYAGPLFTPPDGGRPTMTGVEVSASSHGTVYATWYESAGDHPHLSRSADGGDTWEDVSLEGQLGPSKPYLAGVDPTDPKSVFLRVISADGAADQFEALAVTHDSGTTWALPIMIPGGTLQGFVRRQDGTIAALGKPTNSNGPVAPSTLFRSTDGGASFVGKALAFHGRGLAERDGVLYMPTDNVIDLVALVRSQTGDTWTSLLRFEDISRIKDCVSASCRDACDFLLGNAPIFPPEVCSRAPDAGAGGARGGQGGSAGVGGAAGGGGAGCGCVVAPAGAASATSQLIAFLLGAPVPLAFVVRHRRRRALRAALDHR